MDVLDIILHEHIYQKQDVITLFPLKSHLIFGFFALQKLFVCLKNGSVDPKNALKTQKVPFFSSIPYLF